MLQAIFLILSLSLSGRTKLYITYFQYNTNQTIIIIIIIIIHTQLQKKRSLFSNTNIGINIFSSTVGEIQFNNKRLILKKKVKSRYRIN